MTLRERFREVMDNFDGFIEKDFEYFTIENEDIKDIVRKRIELYILSIKKEMNNNPKEFPCIDQRKLNIELGGISTYNCWFFVAEVNKSQLSQNPHFTFHVGSEGVECMISLQSVRTINKAIKYQ